MKKIPYRRRPFTIFFKDSGCDIPETPNILLIYITKKCYGVSQGGMAVYS